MTVFAVIIVSHENTNFKGIFNIWKVKSLFLDLVHKSHIIRQN